MTVKGGTSQACAACKYQRRKCSATCPLAPYFPPDNPKQFQNAHKLFGVSNILKILNRIDPSQKSEAMRSIIYESNIRDKYPVYGCLGIIMTLQFQIQQVQYECNLVNNQLENMRQQQQQLHCHNAEAVAALPLFNDNVLFNSNVQVTGDEHNDQTMWLQHLYNGNTVTPEMQTPEMQTQTQTHCGVSAPAQSFSCEQQKLHEQMMPPTHEYDEISPFFDTMDSKDAYQSSSDDSSLKNPIEAREKDNVAENELKSAAACFTLTSTLTSALTSVN